MATLVFRPHDPTEDEALVAWIAGGAWPYHVNPRPTPDQVRGWLADGWLAAPDNAAHWGFDGEERVAFLLLTDLHDSNAPQFDLRIRPEHRRRGYGRGAMAWLIAHVRTSLPAFDRIEGQTRRDNLPMRRLFREAGFVKEAHYRLAWPAEGGRKVDGIGYGLLLADHAAGVTTPVDWDDEPA